MLDIDSLPTRNVRSKDVFMAILDINDPQMASKPRQNNLQFLVVIRSQNLTQNSTFGQN